MTGCPSTAYKIHLGLTAADWLNSVFSKGTFPEVRNTPFLPTLHA